MPLWHIRQFKSCMTCSALCAVRAPALRFRAFSGAVKLIGLQVDCRWGKVES